MRRSRLIAGAGPALLLLAALIPPLREPAALAAVLGWLLLAGARSPGAIGWAAVLPLLAAMASPAVLGSDRPLGDPACTDPLSEIAVRRVILALTVLALVAVLARVHRAPAAELGLRRPHGLESMIGGAGMLVLAIGGLVIGPLVAEPFFGRLTFPLPPAALVPAVAFGVANGILEEVAYRGALQAWLGRVAGPSLAVAFQGVVFGIVHAGPEVVDLLPVHVSLLAAVGIAAGVVRARAGSLAIPIGIHIGADIALYVGLACRAPG